MSLSVERLKELLAYETEWLAMFDHAALVRGMADLETRTAALHRDAAKAYSELLAIKEAEPAAWAWRCKGYCDYPNYSISKTRPADSGRDSGAVTEGYDDYPLIRKPA